MKVALVVLICSSAMASEKPVPDLTVPAMEEGSPAPGKRVKVVAEPYKGTDVHHTLYLPADWQEGQCYPVLVEYAGNKWRTSAGTVEGSSLGYGISGGKGFIWLCLPYVSLDHKHNQLNWWGDVEATVAYCISEVRNICAHYGGDTNALFICGFSRGAIACNYIGLHDDAIASLWRGFIVHSHYDGVRQWGYPRSDRASALERLQRLNGRPQFISHEGSVAETKKYLNDVCPDGNFTFRDLKGWDHTDTWTLCDIPARRAVRQWIEEVLK